MRQSSFRRKYLFALVPPQASLPRRMALQRSSWVCVPRQVGMTCILSFTAKSVILTVISNQSCNAHGTKLKRLSAFKSQWSLVLQGHIWRKGFEAGELKGQLFPDVAPQMQQWHSQGIKVYIYSSGSREAQRLLFANSTNGDLRSHISGFFDIAVGPKASLQK